MGSWARWNLSRRRALYNLSKSMHTGGIKTRRSVRQYSTSIVVATFIFLLTFLAVLPLCCRDLPYSQYFHKGDDLEDRVMALNDERLQAAERHLSALDADESRNGYLEAEGGELDLVIAVVTVRRVRAGKTLNYLTQVMSGLDQELKNSDDVFRSTLFICDTQSKPDIHEEAVKLARYFPHKQRFPAGDTTVQSSSERYEKEKEDYVFCLQEALQLRSRYVLLIEDDTLPIPGMLQVIKYSLEHRIEHGSITMSEAESKGGKWAYLKLYYPERWQGYATETRPLIELTGVALLGGSIFMFLFYFIERHRRPFMVYLVPFALGAAYAVALVYMIGRPHVLQWRHVAVQTHAVVPAPNCCSPAILYPANMARKLANFLQETTCTSRFPIDFAMDRFTRKFKLKRYLVEPNIMKHIGMYSSIKSNRKKPEDFFL